MQIYGNAPHLVFLQLTNFFGHEIMEMGMESVDRAIDANGDFVFSHLFKKCCDASTGEVRSSSRHD